MVAARRAARIEQLCNRHSCRCVDGLLVELRPDLVVGRQPVDDPHLLGCWQNASEVLKEVVVSVHESRESRPVPRPSIFRPGRSSALPVPRSRIIPSLIATQASLSSRLSASIVTRTSRCSTRSTWQSPGPGRLARGRIATISSVAPSSRKPLTHAGQAVEQDRHHGDDHDRRPDEAEF